MKNRRAPGRWLRGFFAVTAIGMAAAGCKNPDRSPQSPQTGQGPFVSAGSDAAGGSGAAGAAGAATAVQVAPAPVSSGSRTELAALDGSRREAIAALGFESSHQLCFKAKPVSVGSIDVDRSLFVHDRATLDALGPDGFSLRRTLKKLAGDAIAAGATGATPEGLFRDLWDTQNPRAAAATPEGAQCDDEGTTLNGFPNACRLVDGAQAKGNLEAEIASYRPVALVNRIDLAAEGWKNCGEHRIVYGRQGETFRRSFIIFEAVLPNPRPGCQSGCRAVAEQWYGLSAIANPKERAKRLEELFYSGLPGFRPVVHVDHYAATGASSRYGASGSGQIRTNQFLEGPWMLKEHKLAVDCTTKPCQLDSVPIPVKVNPDGNLWTESLAGLARDFQQKVVLPQVDRLAIDDLNLFSYQVPNVFNAARSESQTGGLQDHYFEAYSATAGEPNGFRAQLAAKAAATSPQLTDKQLVNRAAALSCAGCHQPGVFGLRDADAVGAGKVWPESAGFVHVRAEEQNGVHALSPALTGEFLPFRARNLAEVLNERACLCSFKKPGVDVLKLAARVLRKGPRSLKDLREAEAKLKAEVDRDLVRRGEPTLPELAPDLAAQPLVLDEVRAAGSDAVKRAAARRAAVQKLVAEEPPRKTVTGTFRTH